MRGSVLTGCVAFVLATGAAVAQATPPSTWAERIAAVEAAMPHARGERLTAAHVGRLEALLAALPASPGEHVEAALATLAHRVSTHWLEEGDDATLPERFVAWCEGMSHHPSVTPLVASYLAYAIGETHFTTGDADGAIDGFRRAEELQPALRPHTRARAFRVELDRQNYRAAWAELEAGRAGMDTFREQVYEAHFALRVGLFDCAAQKLAAARAILAEREAAHVAVASEDREQASLVDMELALLRQDYDALEAAALALQQRPLQPAAASRARLRELQARIGRGETVSLATLRELFEGANQLNKPGRAAVLIEQALRCGAEDVARETAERLLAGRALDDPTVTLETLVAVGCYALRPGAEPRPQDWRAWESALDTAWQRLLREWHEVEPDGEALAFLQMETRRNILSLWLRVRRLGAGGAAACFEHYLQADASGSTARRMQLAPIGCEQALADLVPARGALLVFLPAPVGSHALVLDHRGVDVVPLPSEGPLRRRVRALRRAFDQDALDERAWRDLAQPIADQLLPPALRQRIATAETLVVAGYELLHSLPLELLPTDGETEYRWFGLQHAIVYVPSVTLAAHLARRAAAASNGRAEVLAGTTIAPADVARWQHDPIDVATTALRAAFADLEPAALDVRRDASFEPWAGAGTRAEWGTVIAHGISDPHRSCPGGMLLAPARGRETGAVFATDLPPAGTPRGVFLGVCGARRAALRAGEDGGHRFTSAFLAAGSDAVVATDLDVRLDDVLALHGALLAEVLRGADLATALLGARRQLAARGASPRVWAAFRLEGLPSATVRLPASTRSSRTWHLSMWLGAALIAIGAAFVVRCRRAAPAGRC
ncbi:MAG TPA: CHAT domain-containing protein [Planctomycetota bacterium]|nr:CHAT domain-containing protein [Planctomycetota bacterium]